MERRNDHVHMDEVEATGASKEGVVRWVLLGGMLLAIILLSVTWIVPALMQGDVEEEATVSGIVESTADEGDTTDSIVGTGTDVGIGAEEIGSEDSSQEDGLEVIENE